MKNYKQMIEELGFSVVRGSYYGTTDDRIDRWYVEHPAETCLDRRGSGFKTLRDAYYATAEVLTIRQPSFITCLYINAVGERR